VSTTRRPCLEIQRPASMPGSGCRLPFVPDSPLRPGLRRVPGRRARFLWRLVLAPVPRRPPALPVGPSLDYSSPHARRHRRRSPGLPAPAAGLGAGVRAAGPRRWLPAGGAAGCGRRHGTVHPWRPIRRAFRCVARPDKPASPRPADAAAAATERGLIRRKGAPSSGRRVNGGRKSPTPAPPGGRGLAASCRRSDRRPPCRRVPHR